MKETDLAFFENLVGGKDKIDSGMGRQYNMFAMEQGILIAESLQTKDAIIEFNKMGWDDQKRLVPGLSDDHSGNTFNMALRFAIAYLPQLLVNRRDARIDSVIN